MSKHTPEPWIIEGCYSGVRTVAEVRSPIEIVCINSGDDADPPGYMATHANARLLAAAPRLLKVLRELLAAGEESVNSTDDVASMMRFGKAVDEARAAVAAADPEVR